MLKDLSSSALHEPPTSSPKHGSTETLKSRTKPSVATKSTNACDPKLAVARKLSSKSESAASAARRSVAVRAGPSKSLRTSSASAPVAEQLKEWKKGTSMTGLAAPVSNSRKPSSPAGSVARPTPTPAAKAPTSPRGSSSSLRSQKPTKSSLQAPNFRGKSRTEDISPVKKGSSRSPTLKKAANSGANAPSAARCPEAGAALHSNSIPDTILQELLLAMLRKQYDEAFKLSEKLERMEPRDPMLKDYVATLRQKITNAAVTDTESCSSQGSSPKGASSCDYDSESSGGSIEPQAIAGDVIN